MSKVLALTTVPKEPATAPSKKKRERIQLIETSPKPEWFVQTTLKTGRRVWFLRFQVTGIVPRLYGPFNTRQTALLFLDKAIDHLADFWSLVDGECGTRMLRRKFQHIWPPIIEHPLAAKGGR